MCTPEHNDSFGGLRQILETKSRSLACQNGRDKDGCVTRGVKHVRCGQCENVGTNLDHELVTCPDQVCFMCMGPWNPVRSFCEPEMTQIGKFGRVSSEADFRDVSGPRCRPISHTARASFSIESDRKR